MGCFLFLFATKQEHCHCNDQEGRKEGRKEGAKPSPVRLFLVGFAAENPFKRKEFIEKIVSWLRIYNVKSFIKKQKNKNYFQNKNTYYP
jgi:hypothetical protein